MVSSVDCLKEGRGAGSSDKGSNSKRHKAVNVPEGQEQRQEKIGMCLLSGGRRSKGQGYLNLCLY